jgi:hypothetical protein
MASKLDLKPMGSYQDSIDKKAKEQAEREGQLKRQEIEESCCECGQPGGHGDGEFWYCADHLPDDYYAAAVAAEAFTRKMMADGIEWPPRENFYQPPKGSDQ